MPVHHLAETGSDKRADHTGCREDRGTAPFHIPMPGVGQEISRRICGDCDRARADGDMRVSDADDIHEKRHGQNGPAAADETEREPNQRAREQSEAALQKHDPRHDQPRFAS